MKFVKYLVRAVKYFILLVLITTLILVVFKLAGFVGSEPGSMFRNGWDSVKTILIVFGVAGAVYPALGYSKRAIVLPEDQEACAGKLVPMMLELGYMIADEEPGKLTFRAISPIKRIMRAFEDKIIFTFENGSWYIDGINKEAVRLKNIIEYKVSDETE